MDLAEIGRISSKHVKVSGALTTLKAAPPAARPASTPPSTTVVTTMNNHFVNSLTKAESPPPQTEKVEEMDVTEDGATQPLLSACDTEKTEDVPAAMETENSPDEELEDDESRAEGTFQYTLHAVSKLKDTVLSPAYFVRNLPWKIMVMPRLSQSSVSDKHSQKNMAFFLQCNSESDSMSWSCYGIAELKLLSQKPDAKPLVRKIQHLFYCKENDWGFSNFITMSELLDPDKGYIKDDSITLEVYVKADAPHGVSWDSKKHTGYVGLKNQGATCYMNSLLQTLFFTNQLRKAVYMMPTEGDDSSKSVALALQRIFYELQFGDKPVGTKKLTKSFGWETLDSFMQHDVQELCRVLLENMEKKMKGTCVDGTIPKLFEGRMRSYIKCKQVNCISSRPEAFYDLQLNIKGKQNISESFDDYIAVELLEGDNRYDAGDYGLQDAEKGVIFLSFPPVLHLQLMRFQYDPISDCNFKVNDRFEFPERLKLDSYLQSADPSNPADYKLHAVLVHSGDNHGGHYVVYINPKGDGKWFKFDDDVVSRCKSSEAIEYNFGGGGGDDDLFLRQCTNAYMLVYIRESHLSSVLEPVSELDIPDSLIERLLMERQLEVQRRLERTEAHLYMSVQVLLEDSFEGHQGFDLFDVDQVSFRNFRVKKSSTLSDFMKLVSSSLSFTKDQIRPWQLCLRDNQTLRVSAIDLENDANKMIQEIADNSNTWLLFMETTDPERGSMKLPRFHKDEEVLIFLKKYDPKTHSVTYCGHIYIPMAAKLSESLLPTLIERGNFPPGTKLQLFAEVCPTKVIELHSFDRRLDEYFQEVVNGDIIVFQRAYPDMVATKDEFATAVGYFRELLCRLEVTFLDRQQFNTDPGFTLQLSSKMNYDQMAKDVAQYLSTDPYLLQFFSHVGYKDVPDVNPIKCTFSGLLKDLFRSTKPKQPNKIYYQKLSMRIDELENKRQFRCVWMNSNMKEEEIVLYPNKGGCVKDLLEEARKQAKLSKLGSGKLRMLDVVQSRISSIMREDVLLECLQTAPPKSYRIEEVPNDELNLGQDDLLVPAAHFNKEPVNVYGVPFLLRLKNNEQLTKVKERILTKLDMTDKDFEKVRLAVVSQGRLVRYLQEDVDKTVHLEDFQPANTHVSGLIGRPWLGLDHVGNKGVTKATRYNYPEKAIKIHN